MKIANTRCIKTTNCLNLDLLDLRISPHNHVNPLIMLIMVLTMVQTMATTAMAQTIVVTDFAEFQDAVDIYTTATEDVTIEVANDITITSLVNITKSADNGATLTIKSANPALPATLLRGIAVTLSAGLITIPANAKLILADIIIDGDKRGGIGNGGGSLIMVGASTATLTMNSGAIIRNHNASSGGGVYVYVGTFTMNGGKISGNDANDGGGVYVYIDATFAMNGGEISNNIANSSGGGVYIDRGTLTMNGGEISNNEASSGSGSGVYTYGTVTINGGVVAGTGANVDRVIDGTYSFNTVAPANGIIIAQNWTPPYTIFSNNGLSTNPPEGATAIWEIIDGKHGISYKNGDNEGFIERFGITVSKLEPSYTVPAGLTATYGDMLYTVTLPSTGNGTWSWEGDAATKTVGNAGTPISKATFTPTDENYKVITGIDVSIEVAKASYDMSGITFASKTVVHDDEPQSITIGGTLPSGVSVEYVGNAQTEIGEYTVTAIFSVTNPANYNIPVEKTATLTVRAKTAEELCKAEEGEWVGNECKLDNTPVRLPQIANSNIRAFAVNNSIVLEGVPSGAKIKVYNLQGKQVYMNNPKNPLIMKIKVQTKGMYIVKVNTATHRVVVK